MYQVQTDNIAERHQNAFVPLTLVQKHIHTCGAEDILTATENSFIHAVGAS